MYYTPTVINWYSTLSEVNYYQPMFYFLTLQVHIYSISASQTSLWLLFLTQDFINLFPNHLFWQFYVTNSIPFFDSRRLETHCFYIYCLCCIHTWWIGFSIIPRKNAAKKKKTKWLLAHITNSDFLKTETTRSVTCLSSCASVGCVSPGSLPLVGRGTGATQSGIHNLRAAGPCQSSAAAQHVSTPQGAISSPTCNWVFFLLPSYFQTAGLFSNRVDIRLRSKHDFRT